MSRYDIRAHIAAIERATAHNPIRRPKSAPKSRPPQRVYPELKRRRRTPVGNPTPVLALTLLAALTLASLALALL